MITEKQTTMLVRSGVVLATAGTILMAAYALGAFKQMNYIGTENKQVPSISVTGEGEAFATPDMATLEFTVRAESKTQKAASEQVNTTMKKLVDDLKSNGLDEKDIKTTSYDLQPQYDWIQSVCPMPVAGVSQPCNPGKQQLRGYAVSQRIEISMKGKKNFDNAAEFVDVVSKGGATDIGQLSFTVEKPEAIQADAREKAIKEAKKKAEILSEQLGVELVRITGFSEGSNYPVYATGRMLMKADMVANESAAPVLPTGQNQYKSNITITYEIAE